MRLTRIARVASPRDRRALRTGLIVLSPAMFYHLCVRPYVSTTRRAIEALESQRVLLQREEEVIASMPAVRAEGAAAAETGRRIATRTYSATDTVGVMRAFDRDVTAALKDAGLVVQRVEMRDSVSQRSEFPELTIEIRAQGELEDILAALRGLEVNRRLMKVSRLAIEKTGERQPTGAESLLFVATIRGYTQ